MWTDQSRREESANSCLMETCWPAGGVGPSFPLLLPVTDTALFVRDKAAESTQATMSGKGWGQMLWADQAILPPHLTLRILLPNLLNSGDLVSQFPLRHTRPPPPPLTSCLCSSAPRQHPREGETQPGVPVSHACPPALRPPVLSAHSCVLTAFQPLIKCLLYRARAWSVCGGSRKLVGGTPALTALGLSL